MRPRSLRCCARHGPDDVRVLLALDYEETDLPVGRHRLYGRRVPGAVRHRLQANCVTCLCRQSNSQNGRMWSTI